jgi:hypothetical protein
MGIFQPRERFDQIYGGEVLRIFRRLEMSGFFFVRERCSLVIPSEARNLSDGFEVLLARGLHSK